MLDKPAYRLFIVLSLLLVFVTPMVIQDFHVMIEHHEVERVCDAPGDNDHLHNQENHHRSCVLCHLNYSEYLDISQPSDGIDVPYFLNQLAISAIAAVPAGYSAAAQQRGPPNRA